MKKKFWKQTQMPAPEPTAYELGTLGGLSDLVNENFKEFDRERKITLRAIAENAPQMVAAYDKWRSSAAAWLELATRFNLAERHQIAEAVRLGDGEIGFYRELAEYSQSVEWPEEIEDNAEAKQS